MLKKMVILTFILTMSGCCRVFGLCTSVDVHTSLDPSYQVAQQDALNTDARVCQK